MLKVKECKALARRTLAGKYKIVIGAYFINIAISCVMWILTAICVIYALFAGGLFGGGAFSFIKVTAGVMAAIAMTVVSIFIGMWFDIGTTKLMLNICRGDKYKVTDVFYGFRSGSNTIGYILTGFCIWLISFGINLAARILTALSGLLFGSDTTAGISAALILSIVFIVITAYAMTSLMLAKIIIADKPNTVIAQALRKSRELMRGRMLKGVWLMYLSFIFWDILMMVCSISALWIIPYMTCTTIIFYMEADGTLWQLPDPDRDKVRSKSAENADCSESVGNDADSTAAGISGSDSSSENETDAGTASVQNEYGNFGASAADGAAGENLVHETADAGDTAGTCIQADSDAKQDNSAEAAHDAVSADNSAGTAADTVRDGDTADAAGISTEASGTDDSAARSDETDRKSDSWEQTISEMHIELPDGFNKTDI